MAQACLRVLPLRVQLEDSTGAAIYALTVIVGACLLFLVQPLIAKLILPWFGGASAVWSAALLFFQACLFGGYVYAHGIVRAAPRTQAIVHTLLLLASCALLPILPSDELKPTGDSNPVIQTLYLLAVTVGLPAVALSSTSPLLQVWFMRRTGDQLPYRLYALSNAGSLIALLGFPLLLEPVFDSRTLALLWSGAFVVFAVLSIAAAWMSLRVRGSASGQAKPTQLPQRAPGTAQMTLWLLFSACGSALLVAVTAHLSVNVAPIPLLWVVPLALYLLTFILNFGNVRVYNRAAFFPLVAAALGCMTYLYMRVDTNPHIRYAIPLYLASLFVVCMACHGELIQRRPVPAYLTRFYLLIALGGVLGGAFVAVLAPMLFDSYWELPIVLIAVAALAVFVQWRRGGGPLRIWLVRCVMVAGVVAMTVFLVLTEVSFRDGYLLVERNFYGVLRVRDYDAGEEHARRTLFHGTISHGYQFRNDAYRDVGGSYYSTNSGVARAILAMHADGPIKMGVIGLGAGVLASYAHSGDAVTMYELNPAVVRVANEYFDFLERARERGAQVEVIQGDARLSLERQGPQQFDLIAVDAFSSDAIPVHLLTREAMEQYARHLKPDGVLALHISNRYVDLEPVCARAAEHLNRAALVVEQASDLIMHGTTWVLITSNADLLGREPFEGAVLRAATADPQFRMWTDQYSNLVSLLRLRRN
jgi:SAM-dependent methyltransferase